MAVRVSAHSLRPVRRVLSPTGSGWRTSWMAATVIIVLVAAWLGGPWYGLGGVLLGYLARSVAEALGMTSPPD